MMFRYYTILFLFFLSAGCMYGQRPLKIGVQAIAGISKVTIQSEYSKNRNYGYESSIGPTLEIPINSRISMQTGVLYMKLNVDYYRHIESEHQIRYFAVPFDFKYYFGRSNRSYFINSGFTQWLGMKQTIIPHLPGVQPYTYTDHRKRDLMGQIGIGRSFTLKNDGRLQVSTFYAGNPSVTLRDLLNFFKIEKRYFGLSHLMAQVNVMF